MKHRRLRPDETSSRKERRGSDSEMSGQGGRLEAKGALLLMASAFSVTSEV